MRTQDMLTVLDQHVEEVREELQWSYNELTRTGFYRDVPFRGTVRSQVKAALAWLDNRNRPLSHGARTQLSHAVRLTLFGEGVEA